MKLYIISAVFVLQLFALTSCTKGESDMQATDEESEQPPGTALQQNNSLAIFPGKYYYPNVTWTFPWYNTLEIRNFYHVKYMKKTMKVFVKRDGSNDWIEVPRLSDPWEGSLYEYFVVTKPYEYYEYRSLIIFYYGNDVSDTPDVKVVFL